METEVAAGVEVQAEETPDEVYFRALLDVLLPMENWDWQAVEAAKSVPIPEGVMCPRFVQSSAMYAYIVDGGDDAYTWACHSAGGEVLMVFRDWDVDEFPLLTELLLMQIEGQTCNSGYINEDTVAAFRGMVALCEAMIAQFTPAKFCPKCHFFLQHCDCSSSRG